MSSAMLFKLDFTLLSPRAIRRDNCELPHVPEISNGLPLER